MVYLGKDRKNVTGTVRATHASGTGLSSRIKIVGSKLYMDRFFSSPDLFDGLHSKTINSCGTVRSNLNGMPLDIGNNMKLKWVDIKTRVRGNLTVISMEGQKGHKHVDEYALSSSRR
jgi:hypothetical protein